MARNGERNYILHGLDCASCAAEIERSVAALPSVQSASVDFLRSKMRIVLHSDGTDESSSWQQVEDLVRHVEPTVQLQWQQESSQVALSERSNTLLLVRFFCALLLLGASRFVVAPYQLILLLAAYLLAGFDVLYRALVNIRHARLFDENFLMTVATVGALAIGDTLEAVAVMLFYQVGEYFQTLAVNRSRRSIVELMDIQSETAVVKREGHVFEIPTHEVHLDDLLVIRRGEKFPVDAVITEGYSTLDTSALTGESLPVDVGPSSLAYSGSINTGHMLEARATSTWENSTVSRILRLVEEASERKAHSEQFITRFARYYTPIVVIIALLLATLPPLLIPKMLFSTWIYRALVFLVISCPCALVVSIPMGFFGGLGGASRLGVLVKGSNYLEALARVETMVFDKTGTLTTGQVVVDKLMVAKGVSFEESYLARLAASVEQFSSHPIAQAIQAHADGELFDVSDFIEEPGKGLQANADGHQILLGNELWLFQHNIQVPAEKQNEVLLALDGEFVASFMLSDQVKGEARTFIATLTDLGIDNTAILSGDSQERVSTLAHELGITNAYGNLLPDEKIVQLESLLATKTAHRTLAFVGDGINDAPTLRRADLGIAMGSLGSSAAIEAADIVVMGDHLERISDSITLARKTMTVVKQNIIFALSVKTLLLILGAFGLASMWAAVFADTGVALLAVLNALRPLYFARKIKSSQTCHLQRVS